MDVLIWIFKNWKNLGKILVTGKGPSPQKSDSCSLNDLKMKVAESN